MTDEQQKASDAMMKGWEKQSLQAAYDEIDRECRVRQRCFPKWIEDGKITATDARDRLQRLARAAAELGRLMDETEQATQGQDKQS